MGHISAPIPPAIHRRFARAPAFTAIALITPGDWRSAPTTAVFSVARWRADQAAAVCQRGRTRRHLAAPRRGSRSLPKLNDLADRMHFTYRENGPDLPRELGLWQRVASP